MLDLNSSRWMELDHAYGKAFDIPGLLRTLRTSPVSQDPEPWFSIWSALAHQGDVYSASFAAVPHIVDIALELSNVITFDYLSFPAWVEVCRADKELEVPGDLAEAYFNALRDLNRVVEAAIKRDWDKDFLLSALSALAVSKNFVDVAAKLDAIG